MARTWKPDPTSWRTAPRPQGWKSRIVPAVKTRDGGRCTWVEELEGGGTWRDWAHPKRCTLVGTDVDHMGAPDDHRIEMLRLLCSPHHKRRSSQQANEAKKQRAQARKQPTQPHPGLIA